MAAVGTTAVTTNTPSSVGPGSAPAVRAAVQAGHESLHNQACTEGEGLQAMEIKEVLTRELSEFITAPDVTVVVLEMNSRYVNVIGAVPRSGQIPLVNDLRVLEAIATMGGFALFADTGNVRIVRRQPDGSEVEFRFDYDAYIKGRAPGTNIVLQSGDTIIVPE